MFNVVKGVVVHDDDDKGEIYNEEYKICHYTLALHQPKLALGTFVKFIPM